MDYHNRYMQDTLVYYMNCRKGCDIGCSGCAGCVQIYGTGCGVQWIIVDLLGRSRFGSGGSCLV